MKDALIISFDHPGLIEAISCSGSCMKGWPAVVKTIQGFLDNGYSVRLSILSPTRKHPSLPRIKNLQIGVVWIPMLRYLHGALRRGWMRQLVEICILLLCSIITIWIITKEYFRKRFDIVYSIGEDSALGSGLAGIIYKLPVVHRVLGSQQLGLLMQEKDWGKCRIILNYPLYSSLFWAPSNLKIITDDGSYGDFVADAFASISGAKHLCVLNGRPKIEVPTDIPKLDRNDSFTVGSFSRLVPYKRVDKLVKAISICKKSGLHLQAIIAGGGSEMESLKRLAEELCITSNILWVGNVNHTQILDLMQKCNVVMHLAEYCNLTNVVWEAMSVHRCVILPSDPNVLRYFRHKENAVLLSPDPTPEELAKAFLELSKIPDIVSEIGHRVNNWIANNMMAWNTRIKWEIELIERELL